MDYFPRGPTGYRVKPGKIELANPALRKFNRRVGSTGPQANAQNRFVTKQIGCQDHSASCS